MLYLDSMMMGILDMHRYHSLQCKYGEKSNEVGWANEVPTTKDIRKSNAKAIHYLSKGLLSSNLVTVT